MTEDNLPVRPKSKQIDLKPLIQFILHPTQGFSQMSAGEFPGWAMPMLALSASSLLYIILAGSFKARILATGEIPLPPDFQWWTFQMQDNYLRAQQVQQGAASVYILPAVTGLIGLWLGWAILSGLLHLASTLFGGRGTVESALKVTAWSSLPFVIRDLLRMVYMLIAQHTIGSPGLSGFVAGYGRRYILMGKLFSQTDLFLLWQAFLLVLGFTLLDSLPRRKAVAIVVGVLLLILVAQAGFGTLFASLGGMTVSRPF
jgi:hypothetical protein